MALIDSKNLAHLRNVLATHRQGALLPPVHGRERQIEIGGQLLLSQPDPLAPAPNFGPVHITLPKKGLPFGKSIPYHQLVLQGLTHRNLARQVAVRTSVGFRTGLYG